MRLVKFYIYSEFAFIKARVFVEFYVYGLYRACVVLSPSLLAGMTFVGVIDLARLASVLLYRDRSTGTPLWTLFGLAEMLCYGLMNCGFDSVSPCIVVRTCLLISLGDLVSSGVFRKECYRAGLYGVARLTSTVAAFLSNGLYC